MRRCTIYDELAAMASAADDCAGKGGAAVAQPSRPLPSCTPDKLRRQAVSSRHEETALPSGERPETPVQLGLFAEDGATA